MSALTNSYGGTAGPNHSRGISQDILEIQYISYRVFLPLIIILGLTVSSLGIVVLSRPSLKTTHVNMYFLLLAIADLLIFISSIPTVITLNGCELFSYNYALYFAHVFFTLFYIIQTFSLYIILWVSYDRFLAIWDFRRFNEIQKPKVMHVRLVCTLLLCILIHMKHLIEVDIICSSCQSTTRNITVVGKSDPLCDPSLVYKQSANSCTDGRWLIKDGLHHIAKKDIWRQVFWVVRGLLVSAIPILLVVALNLGIVIAILHRRHATTSTTRSQRRDLSRIYIILAISATFIVCTAPVLIHATFYANNIDDCHGPYSEEIFRGIANLLLLLEHITHFVILCFNANFRGTLKKVICVAYQRMKTQFGYPNLPSHSPPKPITAPDASNAKEPRKARAPPPPIVILDVDQRQQPGRSSEHHQVPLQLATFNSLSHEGSLLPECLQIPQKSPTTSIVTLEEIL